jgi:hypothetical protein
VSNPLGKDTVNLSVNLPLDLYEEIKRLAARNEMKPSGYVRLILNQARKNQTQFEIIEPKVVTHFVLNEPRQVTSYKEEKGRA